MTRLEENIFKAMAAVGLAGIGWLATVQMDSNKVAHNNQIALAETKVIALQTQKDVLALRKELSISKDRISNIDKRLTGVEIRIDVHEKESKG